jgi:hypothetical protein
MWCQRVGSLALLLVRFLRPLLVVGLTLSSVFFSRTLEGQFVHSLPPPIGKKSHALVKKNPSFVYCT